MKKIWLLTVFIVLFSMTAAAQGTGFNFQGRLNDGTSPANGQYDLQFRLYDAIVGGNPIGSLISRPNTVLINGVFSTTLDFGSTAFNSPNSVFIEISLKPGGSPNAYTILGPRQQLTVVPFAVRAMNSTNADNADLLNGINSAGFIRNSTAQQQANFNIQGVGTVGNLGVSSDAFVGGTLNVSGLSSLNNLTVSGTSQLSYLRVFGQSDLIGLNTSGQSTLNGNLSVNGPSSLNGSLGVSGPTNLNSSLGVSGPSALNSGLVVSGGPSTLNGNVAIGGNVTQNRHEGGTVKAMLYVNEDGTIRRCYNGITGSSTGNCGFTVFHTVGRIDSGQYRIDFGFQVDDRFISVVPEGGINVTIVASFYSITANSITVQTNITDIDHLDSYIHDDFMIIVY